MMNLNLGQTVTSKYMNITVTGTIYDMNDTHIWIETEVDLYVCKREDVQLVEETQELPKFRISAKYEANSYQDWDYNIGAEKTAYDRGYDFRITANTREDAEKVYEALQTFLEDKDSGMTLCPDTIEYDDGTCIIIDSSSYDNEYTVKEFKDYMKCFYKEFKAMNK